MTLPLVLLNRRRIGGTVAFVPAALLAGSTALLWLDPSDLTTLFQGAAGTTPVTAPGQPVGLALDKSQGLVLGPELVTNGDFSSATGWTLSAGWSITGGALVGTSVGAFSTAVQTSVTTAGKTYRVSLTVVVTAGALNLGLPPGSGGSIDISATGSYSYLMVANTGNVGVRAGGGGFTGTVDNFSVRELPGFHATASGTSRPTYGVVPSRGRVNLLTRTEEFGNSKWSSIVNLSVSSNVDTAPDGTTTADKITENTADNRHILSDFAAGTSVTIGSIYTMSVAMKASGRNFGAICFATPTKAFSVVFDLVNGVAGATASSNSPTSTSYSIASLGNGWFRCSVSMAADNPTIYTQFAISNALSPTFDGVQPKYQGDGTSGILLWGAQLELGSTASPYQRVGSAFDVTDPVGFPSYPCHYLSFDGVDDFMQTPTITPNADKVQVFAGVRKLSDAAQGMVAELSAIITNVGTFNLQAPSASPSQLRFVSGGSLFGSGIVDAVAGYAAPITNVLTGLGDISGDLAALRVNGTQAAQSTADQGAGNYLAYPLFIGRRGGTTLPFNGQLFSLIVRFSTANLDAGLISQTERWVAQKTPGVTIA